MNRPALAACSIACFASAILLWPASVRSQLDVRPNERSLDAVPRTQPSLRAVAPESDAFAPRAVVEDDPPPLRPVTPALPALRAIQPPSAFERRVALTRVTAIATGADPTAVVEGGSGPHIVNVGDPLEGSTIVAIDDDAIRLADGRRLPLEPPDESR